MDISSCNEIARLAALYRCHILDTGADEAFDDAARLAAYVCKTPMAAVSLVDSHRLWLKARVGIFSQSFARDTSFCNQAILHNDLFVVPDTLADPRFAGNPQLQQDPPVRFYAGMPLITPDGFALGALCVQDIVPRELNAEQMDALHRLSNQVAGHLHDSRRVESSLQDVVLYELASHRFLELFQGLPVACCCYNAEGRIFEWNHAFEVLYDLKTEQILERTLWDTVSSPDEAVMMRKIVKRVFTGEAIEGLERCDVRSDGSPCYVLCNTFPLYGSGTKVLGGICASIDITDRKKAELKIQEQMQQINIHSTELEYQRRRLQDANDKLEELARLDGMTGLKNYRAFQQRLRVEFARAERYIMPLSLILLDVDQFKSYNDTYGHPAGDEVLIAIAQILQEAARGIDFVARYGGEEFVIIMPNTGMEGAIRIAERMRAAIEDFQWPERSVTASAGISTISSSIDTSALLLTHADRALYHAKNHGRNQVTHIAQLNHPTNSLISIKS
jgi:diguanylate cyclase (GGDEF)-like protein/PAS domain S-box-containing protein